MFKKLLFLSLLSKFCKFLFPVSNFNDYDKQYRNNKYCQR